MSPINDGGGPAFPVAGHHRETANGPTIVGQLADGMSLRDWFAGQALVGLLGRSWDHLTDDDTRIEAWGRAAYRVADAMLKARASQAGE